MDRNPLLPLEFKCCLFVLSKGNIIDLPKDEDTPKKRVDKIFKQMDKVCPFILCVLRNAARLESQRLSPFFN